MDRFDYTIAYTTDNGRTERHIHINNCTYDEAWHEAESLGHTILWVDKW